VNRSEPLSATGAAPVVAPAQGDRTIPANDGVAEARRWYLQRVSAMVLAVCVLVHLAVMIYAVRGGLSGGEILSRTQGSWSFGAFYALFVVACAVHVPPGLANIAVEWLRWTPARALLAARLFGLLILVTGLRAVYAVVAT
jgi:fumarate reductase subunit C